MVRHARIVISTIVDAPLMLANNCADPLFRKTSEVTNHVAMSSPAPQSCPGDDWTRHQFQSMEEHQGLLKCLRPDMAWTSRQLSAGAIRGSVLTSRSPRYTVTCTYSSGNFEMHGPASTDHMVLAVALSIATPGLQWMRPIETGMVGVYQRGEAVNAVNRGAISFAVIDIAPEELEHEARREGVIIETSRLTESGLVPGRVPQQFLSQLQHLVGLRHQDDSVALPSGLSLQAMLLATTVRHLAGIQRIEHGMPQGGYCRIVARARAWIEAHLDSPIAIDDLVAAAITSRRTLHRAFVEVLGETPQTYVLKMRLNRIRQDLASPAEAVRTVTTVSHQWGIPELGRLAARYRQQFGELPKETLARRQAT